MHKHVYFVETNTLSILGGGNTLEVPYTLWGILRSYLSDDDWTYLKISFAGQAEVVKVVGFIEPNRLVVVRAQDNTVRGTFPIRAILSYVETVAGVLDTYSVSRLNIDTLGAVKYAAGVITIPMVQVHGLGGIGIPNSAALGCCPVDTAPEIPLNLEPLRITSGKVVRFTSDNEYRVWR